MVDADDLNSKKEILEKLIDGYYNKKNEILNIQGVCMQHAYNHFNGQINNLQDIAIKNIIDKTNKNTSTTGFLLDVALSCVLGVVVGYLAESVAKPFLMKFVTNRNRDLDALNRVVNNVELKKLFNMHQNRMSSLLDELTPEVREQAVKLIKGPLHRPMVEVAREVQILELKERISVRDFVELYTAAGNDIIQATWSKFIEKGLPEGEIKRKEEEKKAKIEKLYNKTREQNVYETITKMVEDTDTYAQLQITFNNLFRDLFHFLRRIILDLDSLDTLTKYFENQFALLKTTTGIEELKRIYQQLFQSIFWLLYLGNPGDWIGIPAIGAGRVIREKFEEIKEEELGIYTIKKVDIHRYVVLLGLDTKSAFEFNKETRIPLYKSGMEKLYRPRLNINIPYVLLSYLTRNFGDKFGTESFLDEAIRKRKVQMRKEEGFGIDAPEPMTIRDIKDMDWDRLNLLAHSSPFVDPMHDAAYLLTEWFLKIQSDLNKNHELKTLLQRGKNFTGDFIMKYSLPSKAT